MQVRNLTRLLLLVAMIVSISSAQAEGSFELLPHPTWESADGSWLVRARGRIVQDFVWAKDSDGTMDISESETRAGRIGFEARHRNDIRIRAEAQLLNSDVVITVADVTYQGAVEVTAGFFKLGAPMSESTSSKNINLMERGHFTDAFNFSRGLGVMLAKRGDHWSLEAGAQKGDLNHSVKGAPLIYAARTTYAFLGENSTVHLGINARRREADSDPATFGYDQRTHLHVGDKFVDVGEIADADSTFGGEFAFVMGPYSLDAEYSVLKARLADPAATEPNPTFSGGYVAASLFMTGARRNYNARRGSFGAPKLTSSVLDGGMGAIELVARYDRTDLTSGTFGGGEQNSYTLGANWYLHKYARVMVNYTHAQISNAYLVFSNGDDGANSVDSVGVRLQAAW